MKFILVVEEIVDEEEFLDKVVIYFKTGINILNERNDNKKDDTMTLKQEFEVKQEQK